MGKKRKQHAGQHASLPDHPTHRILREARTEISAARHHWNTAGHLHLGMAVGVAASLYAGSHMSELFFLVDVCIAAYFEYQRRG